MNAPRLDTLNAAQRRTASRSLYIRRARLPLWAVVRIVKVGTQMRSDNDSGCGLSGPAQDWADEAWRIRAEAIAKGMEEGK